MNETGHAHLADRRDIKSSEPRETPSLEIAPYRSAPGYNPVGLNESEDLLSISLRERRKRVRCTVHVPC
jgi:hypothetical protein